MHPQTKVTPDSKLKRILQMQSLYPYTFFTDFLLILKGVEAEGQKWEPWIGSVHIHLNDDVWIGLTTTHTLLKVLDEFPDLSEEKNAISTLALSAPEYVKHLTTNITSRHIRTKWNVPPKVPNYFQLSNPQVWGRVFKGLRGSITAMPCLSET